MVQKNTSIWRAEFSGNERFFVIANDPADALTLSEKAYRESEWNDRNEDGDLVSLVLIGEVSEGLK